MRKIEVGDRVRIIKIDKTSWEKIAQTENDLEDVLSDTYLGYISKEGVVVSIKENTFGTKDMARVKFVEEDVFGLPFEYVDWLFTEIEPC